MSDRDDNSSQSAWRQHVDFYSDGEENIDEVIELRVIQSLQNKNLDYGYDLTLYDKLAVGVSDLLERCIQYRARINELESAAESRAIDLKLQIALAGWETDRLARVDSASDFQEVARSLATTSVPNEIRETILAAMKIVTKNVNEENATRLSQTNQVLAAAIAAQENQLGGGPSDGVERAQRYMNYLVEDFAEAINKSRAIFAGLVSVLGVGGNLFDLPILNEPNLLDRFVIWIRDVNRFLETMELEEKATTVTVPLGSVLWKGKEQIKSRDQLSEFLNGTNSIEFSIPNGHFENMDRVRLRRIWLECYNKQQLNRPDRDLYWFDASIKTPGVPLNAKFQGSLPLNTIDRRGSEFLLTVGSAYSQFSTAVDGLAVRNHTPFGQWRIRKETLTGFPLKSGVHNEIENLFLCLDVVYRDSTDWHEVFLTEWDPNRG